MFVKTVSDSESTFSFPYVLFMTKVPLYHVCDLRVADIVLINKSSFTSRMKSIIELSMRNVAACETIVTAAERTMIGWF